MNPPNVMRLDLKLNSKAIIAFGILILLPNLLSLVNIPTPLGPKLHLFQLGIFIAALVFGPTGGAMSGLVGSIYPALAISNSFIILGNALLGFFFGLFTRMKFSVVLSVVLAYAIQLAWLIPSDFYLANLPAEFIRSLIVALLLSNIIWAIIAAYAARPIREFLK